MKGFPILVLFMCFSIPCICQIEWVSEHSRPEELNTFVVTSQGHHVINFTTDSPNLVAINGQGNEVFQFSESSLFPGTSLENISDIIELADTAIAFPYIGLAIDGGGIAYFSYLVGTVDKDYQNLSDCWHGIENIFKAPNGGALSDNSLVLYDIDEYFGAKNLDDACLSVWEVDIEPQTLDLAVTSSDLMVWSGDNGLTIMDADGNIDSVYSNLPFDEVQATSFDGIIGLRQDSIFLLSPEFEPLESRGFPNENILDFSVAHKRLAVLTEGKMVHLFSDSLVFQNSFELTDESRFERIDIGNDGLGLAGVETYGSEIPSGGTNAFFSKSYSFEGDNHDMSRDVGIVEVQLGEVSHVTVDPVRPDLFRVYFDDAAVTVENFGDEVVEDCLIRSGVFFKQPFTNLSLPASETVTLELDDLWFRSEDGPGSMESICLWTSHPDRRLDEDSTNDGLCTDFLVNAEEELENVVFGVYPNPATDGGTVHFDLQGKEGATLKMFDSLGREVYSAPLSGSPGVASLPKMATGLYHLTLSIERTPVKTIRFVQF